MGAKRILRYLARGAGVLLAVYGLFLAFVFFAMNQPPDRFGQIMARMPMPLFIVVPFKTMWYSARGGDLKVGDVAPDFNLRTTADRESRVRLSSLRGERPVALVFGSYT